MTRRRFDWSARSIGDDLDGWDAMLDRVWPAYRAWWLQDGDEARPPLDLCHAALDKHMHELLPLWERLGQNASDRRKRFLSFWSPPAYIKACSQAAVSRPAPLLVRNYDYGADAFDCLVMRTDWLGRRVIGTSDGLWGLLDGINDAGLAMSLAFGGRWQTGSGFGIPLILRYALQMAETTKEAVAILKQVPSHMSYNVTCLDRQGRFATVVLGPDRAPRVRRAGIATNHQRDEPEWPEHAELTHTRERYACLEQISRTAEPGAGLVERFLSAPLHVPDFTDGFGTLYTAAYHPECGTMGLHWPGVSRRMSLDESPHWDLSVELGTAETAA